MDKTYKGKAAVTVKPYGKRKEEKRIVKLEFTAPSVYVAEDIYIIHIAMHNTMLCMVDSIILAMMARLMNLLTSHVKVSGIMTGF